MSWVLNEGPIDVLQLRCLKNLTCKKCVRLRLPAVALQASNKHGLQDHTVLHIGKTAEVREESRGCFHALILGWLQEPP